MTPAQIGILVLVFIGLAFLLAVAINRMGWWKEIETPTIKRSQVPPFRNPTQPEPNIVPVDGFKLNERAIHKSAARPSNVMTLARKPTRKSTPKTAA